MTAKDVNRERQSAGILRMRAIQRLLDIKSRTAVYDLMRGDPTFPRPRKLGTHSIGWLQVEVEDWMRALPVAEPDGLDAVARRRGCAA